MWVMSSRRVLGGIEVFIGCIRVACIRWVDGMTFLDIPGHETFEVPNTSEALRHMHVMLKHEPPEGAEVSNFNKRKAS